MTRTEQNLIGGEWESAVGGGWIPVVDPVDDATIVAQVPEMEGADVDAVMRSAVEGQRRWGATSGPDRAGVLLRAASLLRERSEAIVADLVAEMGKTAAEASVEVERSADFFDFYSSFGRLPRGDVIPDRRADVTWTVREPVGVVLAITPWNDPLLTPARKLAPALVAGNAVVLKTATHTPLVGIHLARALHDAGLPAGTIGTVTGHGSAVGPRLLADPRVDAVTFTGSTETGLALRQAVADRNIRLQTEMGGKNAAVILGDADMDVAVAQVAGAAFGQGGQRCTATSRLLVEAEAFDEVLDRMTAACGEIVLGPGRDPATTMGPMVSRDHQSDVLGAIEKATRDGAAVVFGGGTPSEPLAAGCFVEPTVITDVDPSMSIWRDEVFGPVLAVRPTGSLDEAIVEVNDSPYGLSSAIFTRDLAAAHRFLAEVDTGQVAVNLSTSGWDVHIPFGGFGDSGSAFKEQGTEAMQFFTKVKTVSIGP